MQSSLEPMFHLSFKYKMCMQMDWNSQIMPSRLLFIESLIFVSLMCKLCGTFELVCLKKTYLSKYWIIWYVVTKLWFKLCDLSYMKKSKWERKNDEIKICLNYAKMHKIMRQNSHKTVIRPHLKLPASLFKNKQVFFLTVQCLMWDKIKKDRSNFEVLSDNLIKRMSSIEIIRLNSLDYTLVACQFAVQTQFKFCTENSCLLRANSQLDYLIAIKYNENT